MSASCRARPAGPDAEARSKSGSHIVAIAYDAAGRPLSEVHVKGVDGYTFTGRMLAWGADRAAAGALKGTGALGPVDAFGLDELVEGCAEAGISEQGAGGTARRSTAIRRLTNGSVNRCVRRTASQIADAELPRRRLAALGAAGLAALIAGVSVGAGAGDDGDRQPSARGSAPRRRRSSRWTACRCASRSAR